MSVKIDRGTAAGLINLTPMIDVVFQLLLFFMVASKFADEERELRVMLPSASEARPIVVKPEVFYINVDEGGHYFVHGQQIPQAKLEEQLMQLGASNPGRQTVKIRADKRCPWQHVITVMNLCTKANIRDYRATAEGSVPST